ncbi:hypothetical protein BJX76DRAFT_330959 [Aspergillus varians]
MKPDHVQRRIMNWLHSVADDRSPDPERPYKRQRLKSSCFIHSEHFQRASSQDGGHISAPLSTSSSLTQTGPKNNKGASSDDSHLEEDEQEQALASFRASKIPRNISPTKQLRNAEVEETGFLRASIHTSLSPGLLCILVIKLKRVNGGFGILPRDLQDNVRGVPLGNLFYLQYLAESRLMHSNSQLFYQDSFGIWNFGDSPEVGTTQVPDLRTVFKRFDLANRCFLGNYPESSWNSDVYSRVLDWVLRDGPYKDDLVDYRCWQVLLFLRTTGLCR